MAMTVEEIRFNHDKASHATDALTIKYQNGPVIEAPEWKGLVSDPIAYKANTLKGQVQVKAKFKGGPLNGTRRIRAVPVLNNVPAALPSFSFFDAAQMIVPFNNTGASGLVTLNIPPALAANVSVGSFRLEWSWRSKPVAGGSWSEFAVTRHDIHVVAGHPTAPWCQGLVEPPDLSFPWVEALRVGCGWAAGATNVDEATDRVTRAINGLHNQNYPPQPIPPEIAARLFVGGADGPFNLDFFLHEITSTSFHNECRGTTGALVTFANLMGDRLCPLQMYRPKDTFGTHKVRLLNATAAEKRVFGNHEVATKPDPPLDESLPVYDACLQFEADAVPPIAEPLGQLADVNQAGRDYLFRLIELNTVENRLRIPPRRVF